MEPLPRELWGRHLRRAALAILLKANRPVSVAEIFLVLEERGYVITGPRPRQALGDALGWEHQRGWAKRVSRGCYQVGSISRSSRWRILNCFR